MGRGIIDVPVKEVAEFVKDVQNNMTWDDLLIVSITSESHTLCDPLSVCKTIYFLFSLTLGSEVLENTISA